MKMKGCKLSEVHFGTDSLMKRDLASFDGTQAKP